MYGSEIGITKITVEGALINALVVIVLVLLTWFMIQFISRKLKSSS